jgi:hypothetical protein
MTEHDWKPYYDATNPNPSRLYASDWHQRFDASDARSQLTWENRFSHVFTSVRTYDFFSPDDDVFANADDVDSASIAGLILRQGFDFSTGAWKCQELVKGVSFFTSAASVFMSRGQAGWGFNPAWHIVGGPASEAQVPTTALATQPFFRPFLETALINADAAIASPQAGVRTVQYDVLARGIPSKSYAVATSSLAALESIDSTLNFDMEAQGRVNGQWPTEGHTVSGNQGHWLHSDFKGVSLPYVHLMYEAMIAKGSLE